MEKDTKPCSNEPLSENSQEESEGSSEELVNNSDKYKPEEPEILGDKISQLALSTDYLEKNTAVHELSGITVRKPKKTEFFRVIEGYELCTVGFPYGTQEELYLTTEAFGAAISDVLTPYRLVLVQNNDGAFYIWPIRLPTPEMDNSWFRSAGNCADRAINDWVRISANRASGGYDLTISKNIKKEPTKPPASMSELVDMGFRGRIILSSDHPIIAELSGDKVDSNLL